MDVFNLQATLGIDTSLFLRGLAGAKTAAASFAKAGTLAFAMAGTAVTAFGAKSVQVGKQFDSSMSQLSATMGENAQKMIEYNGETMSSIDALRGFAKEMGATTMFSASQSADALNILAMAGYTAEKQMETLPAVLNMAAAGGMGIAEAADYATGIIAGFSNENLDAATIADKLATVASNAKGSVASFGQGLSTVAGMANTTGQTLQDMTVALGILGNNNYSASEAGNALSRTLRNIYQPSDTAKEALDELGISAYDSAGTARPLQDVLIDINSALDGLNDQAKNEVLSKIFDAVTLKSVPALLKNAGTQWNELSNKIANSEGAADKMAKTMQNNLSGAITTFKSALEGVQIEISEQLTPTITEFVNVATAGLSGITTGFKDEGLGGAMTAIGDFLSNVVALIVSKIPTFVEASYDIIVALVAGINDNIDIIVDAIIETVPILIDGLTEILPTLIDGFFQFVVKIADGLTTLIPNILPQIIETISTISSLIVDNLGSMGDSAMKIVDVFSDALLENLPTIIQTTFEILDKVIDVITEPENLAKILELAVKLTITLVTALMEALPELLLGVERIIQTVIENILTADWGNIGAEITNIVVESLDNAADKLYNWWEDRKTYIKGKISWIKDGLKDGLKDGWNALSNMAARWGMDLIHNFINGIMSRVAEFKNTIEGIAGIVSDFLHFSLPEKGPLATSDEWMPDFMKNLAEGIEKNKSLVTQAMADLSSDMSADLNINANQNGGYGGQSPILNFEFRIGNVNGATQEDAQSFAQTISDEISNIIYRQKAAII